MSRIKALTFPVNALSFLRKNITFAVMKKNMPKFGKSLGYHFAIGYPF